MPKGAEPEFEGDRQHPGRSEFESKVTDLELIAKLLVDRNLQGPDHRCSVEG